MSREEIGAKCYDVVMGVRESVIDAFVEKIPVVGFFVKTAKNIKNQTLQRRYEMWQYKVGERLATLEDAVFDTLGENETFTTAFVKTSELAAQSNEKKMECLANALLYIAQNVIKEDYMIIFLNDIAKYSLSHLMVMQYFYNPTKYYPDSTLVMASPLESFYKMFPRCETDIMATITSELKADGLFNDDMEALIGATYPFIKRTSKLGDKFIEFFGLNEIEL